MSVPFLTETADQNYCWRVIQGECAFLLLKNVWVHKKEEIVSQAKKKDVIKIPSDHWIQKYP